MKAEVQRGMPLAAGMLITLLTINLLPGTVPRAHGARSQEFAIDSLKEVLTGELIDMGVSAAGGLRPAPATKLLFSGEANYVWSLLADGQRGVFAATGSGGVLYRISASGETETWIETFEYELFALARDDRGNLLVSGAPNGTILRVTAAGESDTVLDLPEGLVWDLLAAPDATLYVATGESGEIYRVKQDGKTERVGRLPDVHAVTLAWWNDGLLCGTDGRGLLAWLDPASGESEILYDSTQEEIVALLPLEDGRILFAANGSTTGQVSEGRDGFSMSTFEIRPEGPATAVLYERDRNGQVRAVWNCPEENILCLALAPDGGILAGTGQTGILYHLDERWTPTRLLDLREAQVLTLAASGSRVFVGTGNPGAVYLLDWKAARKGVYESKVFDAAQTARWGRPHYLLVGKGELEISTRSGQVKEAGDAWSDWAALTTGAISSPPARYLQLRLELACPAEGHVELRDLRVPYRGPNRQPAVSDLAVSSQAADLQGSANNRGGSVRQVLPGGVQVDFTLSDNGRPASLSLERAGHWARSLRTAIWSARDPDGDPLTFDLYLRELGETVWRPLKRELTERAYSWDGSAWPEGWYELRVVAHDDAGNPPGEELAGEAVSAPFQIDNTPPILENVKLTPEGDGGWRISGRARDGLSRIMGLEYSLNGEGWKMALPADGLFDSQTESFQILIPAPADGQPLSVIGLRAADEAGHLAVTRLAVPEEAGKQ